MAAEATREELLRRLRDPTLTIVDVLGVAPAARPVAPERRSWGNAVLEALERRSTSELFALWLAMVVACALVYWLAGVAGRGLVAAGAPVGTTPAGFATALYFSFVTATSVGYGDVLPTGPLRALAVAEAVAGLLAFGAVVAKFVSRRQDELVREIHRVTFEERLDRVQTNLHLVLSELQAIGAECGSETVRRWSSPASCARRQMVALAGDICSHCVPREPGPMLTMWMDRVQEAARQLA